MIRAFTLGLDDLLLPAGRRLVGMAIVLAAVAFAALFAGVETAIGSAGGPGWLHSLLSVLGGLATIAVTWILFPAVATFFVSLLLDRFVAAVEARHYPSDPGRDLPLVTAIVAAARFAVVSIAINLIALPLYLVLLLIPVLLPVAFYAVNGYLLGREYFELAAHRHMPPGAARVLRAEHRWLVFGFGVGIAFLFTVPFVNLVAPVLAAAAMTHLLFSLRA